MDIDTESRWYLEEFHGEDATVCNHYKVVTSMGSQCIQKIVIVSDPHRRIDGDVMSDSE
jgi:hypothetical protein